MAAFAPSEEAAGRTAAESTPSAGARAVSLAPTMDWIVSGVLNEVARQRHQSQPKTFVDSLDAQDLDLCFQYFDVAYPRDLPPLW
jgi:hypothetical protein